MMFLCKNEFTHEMHGCIYCRPTHSKWMCCICCFSCTLIKWNTSNSSKVLSGDQCRGGKPHHRVKGTVACVSWCVQRHVMSAGEGGCGLVLALSSWLQLSAASCPPLLPTNGSFSSLIMCLAPWLSPALQQEVSLVFFPLLLFSPSSWQPRSQPYLRPLFFFFLPRLSPLLCRAWEPRQTGGEHRQRPRSAPSSPGQGEQVMEAPAEEKEPSPMDKSLPLPTLSPAVPPYVTLGLTVVYTVFYSLLFIFIYVQLWLVLRYRHKRFSYQTVFLSLCLLWSALRTVLFSFYFKNFITANTLGPFPFWLLYCFPVCLQFFTLSLMNLYFAQVS